MKHHLSSRISAFLILLFGIFLLSIAPLIVRWAEAPGVVTSFYRMFLAACIITAINLFRKKSSKKTSYSWRIWILPILAGICSGFDHSLWSTAIENTFIAKANLLNFIAPLWVGLAAVLFFRTKYPSSFWIGIFVVLAGAWAISGAKINDFSTLKFNGEGFAFISSFFYASYILLSEQSRRTYGSLDFVQRSSFAASAVLAVIILINGHSFAGYSAQTYLLFLAVGIISQIGGYLCLVYSLGKLPAPLVSPMLLLQPVLTAIWASLLFNEKLQSAHLIGGILVLAGIFIIGQAKPKEIPDLKKVDIKSIP